jgi:hypothetical protein
MNGSPLPKEKLRWLLNPRLFLAGGIRDGHRISGRLSVIAGMAACQSDVRLPRKRTSAAYSIIDLLESRLPLRCMHTDWSSRIGLLRRTPMLAFS